MGKALKRIPLPRCSGFREAEFPDMTFLPVVGAGYGR